MNARVSSFLFECLNKTIKKSNKREMLKLFPQVLTEAMFSKPVDLIYQFLNSTKIFNLICIKNHISLENY